MVGRDDLDYVTVVPSGIVTEQGQGGSGAIVVAILPLPDGPMYSITQDGETRFMTESPFMPEVDVDALAVGPLDYSGLGSGGSTPKGAQLVAILGTTLKTPAGRGTYYWDGDWFECQWTGGDVETPSKGVIRDTVDVTCDEAEPSASGPSATATAACGPAETTAVAADMAAGSSSLPISRRQFQKGWNARFPGEEGEFLRLDGMQPLGGASGFQSYGAFIAVTNCQNMLYVLDGAGDTLQSAAILVAPETSETGPLGSTPITSGGLMTDFAELFVEDGTELLNDLGMFLPLTDYDDLAGINTCVQAGPLYFRLVDVQQQGHERLIYLLARGQ